LSAKPLAVLREATEAVVSNKECFDPVAVLPVVVAALLRQQSGSSSGSRQSASG
jgi:hypothetical protein